MLARDHLQSDVMKGEGERIPIVGGRGHRDKVGRGGRVERGHLLADVRLVVEARAQVLVLVEAKGKVERHEVREVAAVAVARLQDEVVALAPARSGACRRGAPGSWPRRL